MGRRPSLQLQRAFRRTSKVPETKRNQYIRQRHLPIQSTIAKLLLVKARRRNGVVFAVVVIRRRRRRGLLSNRWRRSRHRWLSSSRLSFGSGHLVACLLVVLFVDRWDPRDHSVNEVSKVNTNDEPDNNKPAYTLDTPPDPDSTLHTGLLLLLLLRAAKTRREKASNETKRKSQ